MVDKGRTVNPARIGFPQYGIYPFGLQHSYKFILAGCLSERGENGSLCPPCKLLFLYFGSGGGAPVIKGFISGILSEAGGFQRISGLVSRIIGRRIDKSPVLPAVYLAPCFLYGDIVEGQQSTVFTERLETVGFREGFQHISDLAFHIPPGYDHFAECPLFQPLPAVSRRVQPVLLFQCIGSPFASAVDVVVVEPLTVLTHTYGNDMQVVAVDVLVLKYDVWLVAVTDFIHVFPCDVRQLRIGQFILRMRIQ